MNREIIRELTVSLMYRECSPALGDPRRPSAHFKHNVTETTIFYISMII